MDKRQAKIEALHIASSLCLSCDMAMWDDDNPRQIKIQMKILDALYSIGDELENRAIKIQSRLLEIIQCTNSQQ